MAPRDRRAVLALAGAAVVWRWLVAHATPMPGEHACRDLWLAAQLAMGHAGDLPARWWEGGFALLLAPFVAAGLAPWTAAQLLGALCGGLVVWFVAAAAERQREGAGVAAAVFAMVAAGPTVAAGSGGATPWHALLVAVAAWCFGRGHHGRAAVAALAAGLGGADHFAGADDLPHVLRLAVGAMPLAVLALLAPRPRLAWPGLAVLAGVLGAAAVWSRPLDVWPAWSPLAALLAGIGVARLATRWRDVVLCVVVAVECHGAWQAIEPAGAAAERVVGRWLARHLPPGQQVVSDLPRVVWAAGARPDAEPIAGLAAAAEWPDVGAVVLSPAAARSATLAAALARRFAEFGLPADLADFAAARGLRVRLRR